MITDTEIRSKGIQILSQYLGDIEAERFVALIQCEPFDYTKWRQNIDDGLSLQEISESATKLRKQDPGQNAT